MAAPQHSLEKVKGSPEPCSTKGLLRGDFCLTPTLSATGSQTASPLLPPLQKAAGYHLDLFWVGILMALCSFMGLPWYVAATVISIAHIDSLKMETETSAPGEQPQFLGVR